ncbi:alanine:cation symporter family protein, partial [Burkholderia multivorans]|uniref:alanine:cation symporter family protein n=1 Tax=Burkholderia multivorans TaxID=87883 RepID=UPI001C65865D
FNYISTSAAAYRFKGAALRIVTRILQVLMVVIAFLSAILPADLIWGIGDIGYGSLGWINMICLVFLAPLVSKVLRDYTAQKKAGLDAGLLQPLIVRAGHGDGRRRVLP